MFITHLPADDIMGKINASGFEVANAKEVQLTKEQAAEFYKEHEGQDYFDKLVTHMSRLLGICHVDVSSLT